MTNREFAEFLIARIEDHKHKLCDGQSSLMNGGYAQAHEHIIELIRIMTDYVELTDNIKGE